MYTKLQIDPDAVFYHGTNAVFEQFEESYKGGHTEWDNTVHGFFFADKKENARLFGDTIIEAHLDVSKPIDLRLHSIFNEESQASVIWEILSGERLTNRKALATLLDEIGLGEVGDMYDALNTEEAHQMIVKAGYDGIISSLGNDEIEYVVFKASQIDVLSIERPLTLGRSGR